MTTEGIGSQLVRHGLALLSESDCPYVIVLGHPEYYPRFGFQKASEYGVKCQWEGIPDEVFMILLLDKSIIPQLAGRAFYREEFSNLM